MNNYEKRARRDRDKYLDALIGFVTTGLICKRLKKHEPLNIQVICTEVSFSNKKCIISNVHSPPNYSNLLTSFKNLRKHLNQTCEN